MFDRNRILHWNIDLCIDHSLRVGQPKDSSIHSSAELELVSGHAPDTVPDRSLLLDQIAGISSGVRS